MHQRITILGNVGNAELKKFANGGRVILFSVAVNGSKRNPEAGKEGEPDWIDDTTWFNCKMPERNRPESLDKAASYIQVGRLLYVEGKMHVRQHEEKYYWELTTSMVRPMPKRSRETLEDAPF